MDREEIARRSLFSERSYLYTYVYADRSMRGPSFAEAKSPFCFWYFAPSRVVAITEQEQRQTVGRGLYPRVYGNPWTRDGLGARPPSGNRSRRSPRSNLYRVSCTTPRLAFSSCTTSITRASQDNTSCRSSEVGQINFVHGFACFEPFALKHSTFIRIPR